MPISLDDATTAHHRVFITGASGFMGHALADRYRAAGVEVRGVDLRADPEHGIVGGDTGDPSTWAQELEGCDLVVHTAAVIAMDGDDEMMWRVNVLGTRRVLDAAVAAGVPRFLHVSSVVAFGFDYPDGVDESWPVRTNGSSYVDTKVAGEQVVLQAHAAGEIPCTIVRPGDIYGPRSQPWTVLPTLGVKAGLRILPDTEDGEINPTYLDNLVDGLILAAAEPAAAGQVITVADGFAMPSQEYFGHYHRIAGTPAGGAPPAELDRHTHGFLTKTGRYSNERARTLLGWEPRVSFDEGMARTEAWLRESGLV